MLFWQRSSGNGASTTAEPLWTFGRQLDLARQGDSEALDRLYRQFLPGVFAYIAARVADRATAEDLTAEVFLKMVEGISKVRASEEASFTAWVFRIARITVAGYYRQREAQPALVSLDPAYWGEEAEARDALSLPATSPEADPVRWAEAREEWGQVASAINALTEEQRQVLISRLIMGYDVATVARMLGKKANAVKALQFRALRSLYRLLGIDAIPQQAPHARARRQGGSRETPS